MVAGVAKTVDEVLKMEKKHQKEDEMSNVVIQVG